MLGTGAAIIIAQSRGSGNLRLAGSASATYASGWVLFSLLMMTVVKCFLTDILRLFGATDELMRRRALFADFDIRQSGLYAGNRRAGGNP